MKIIKQPILYQCNICRKISESKKEIQECESKGKQDVLLKIGDKIYFEDNEITPIIYEKIYNGTIFQFDREIMEMFNKCYMFGQEKYQYEVIDIINKGHDYSYVLGKDGDPIYTFGFNNGKEYKYPVINGNKLMKKILKEYN